MKTINLVEETCCNCGIVFGIEEELRDQRHEDGREFYCPNGHAQHFVESSEDQIERLTRKLKEAEQERYEARNEARQLKCEILRIRTRRTIWQILRLKP